MPLRCGNHDYEELAFRRRLRNIPPDHIILRYDCPCGYYTTYFTIHHYILLHLLGVKTPLRDLKSAGICLDLLDELQGNSNRIKKNGDENNNDNENNNNSEIIER